MNKFPKPRAILGIFIQAAIAMALWVWPVRVSAQAAAGTISGSVQDGGGSAISNATLCAFGFDTFALAGCALSASDGSYSIDGLAPGDYRMEASATGFAFEMYDNLHYGFLINATRVAVAAGEVTAGIDFQLEPGGEISGTVYQTDGVTPIAGISVVAEFPDGSFRGMCTEGDGRFGIDGVVHGVEVRVHAYSAHNFCGGPEEYAEEYWEEAAVAADATLLTLSSSTPSYAGILFSLARFPLASDDTASTSASMPVVIDVAANDTDPDGDLDPATVNVTSGPSNGAAVSNGDGTVTYTPNTGFVGTDSFTYEICDAEGLCDQAEVTIEVVGGVGPPSDPGDVVPDAPANADEHANPNACEDNPGRADEHRPDNTPPCRGD